MFEPLLTSIQHFGNFTEQELTIFESKLEAKTLQKNEYLLQEGQTCQSLAFVKYGSLRHYRLQDDAGELILNLLTENDWALDYQSLVGQKPSKNFIQAFEESQVLVLRLEALHELIAQSQSFLQIGRLFEIGTQDPDFYNDLISPDDRYQNIIAQRPFLIQKFPLKYIASYLRMTPETLSRVRSRLNA